MYLHEAPDGSKAWLCCSVRSALLGRRKQAEGKAHEGVDLESVLSSGMAEEI